MIFFFFFFSSRRRHTRFKCDWSSDVCSSDLGDAAVQVDGLEDVGDARAGVVDQGDQEHHVRAAHLDGLGGQFAQVDQGVGVGGEGEHQVDQPGGRTGRLVLEAFGDLVQGGAVEVEGGQD